jgi:2-polyprenyl-6-methoxyphenol hydroxylase-like FAD-dependent oxidoreductase
MMSAPKLKVLVSGAGIAGPCLAYWLTRTNHNLAITIIERSPFPRVTGQSIDIRGPAIEIVKAMKLEEAVRRRHTTEEGTSFLNASGNVFAQFKAGDTFTAEYEILRADLAGLFLEATESSGKVQYIYGDSIKSLEQTEKGANVAFTGGSKDTFDLVVAADGSTSKTRTMILDDQDLKNSYNFIGQYIAFFSIPSLPTDPKTWQWYNAPKGLGIMLRPHRNTSTMGAYLCITMPAREQRDPAVEEAMDKGLDDTKRMLHSYFEDAGWEAKRVLEGMDSATDFYMSRAAQMKLPKWTNGRALVLGDAAHATFGVGTSLAIESAYILAGELSTIKSSDEIPQALERYEGIFRPLYKNMEELPPGFPQKAFPQTAWGLMLRDSLLWIVSKTRLYKLFQGEGGNEFELPVYDWVK